MGQREISTVAVSEQHRSDVYPDQIAQGTVARQNVEASVAHQSREWIKLIQNFLRAIGEPLALTANVVHAALHTIMRPHVAGCHVVAVPVSLDSGYLAR